MTRALERHRERATERHKGPTSGPPSIQECSFSSTLGAEERSGSNGPSTVAPPDHAHVGLPLGRWSRVRFVNESARLHPIHLHGMFFRLLTRNDTPIDEPFFRDTVLIHAHETIDLGIVPLDEGEWMMHCHILEHAEAGMMSLLDVH